MSTEPDYQPVDGADKLRVIKRFPDRWGSINARFEDSEDFRSLCHEYGLAADALAKLNGHDEENSVDRRAEYRQLVHELESEILKYVDEKVM